MKLNQGQEAALAALMDFLSTDEKYFVLEGEGGVGKTTVLKSLEGALSTFNEHRKLFHLPTYSDLLFCATTNKAATLFDRASTIHKCFSLRVIADHSTGKTHTAPTSKTKVLTNSILVIDEASMIDGEMEKIIDDYTDSTSTKVIFLLDHCQLAPVGEQYPRVHLRGYATATLTEPMRQDPNSHLYKQCHSLREAVKYEQRAPIIAGEYVRIVSSETFTTELLESCRNQESCRAIAYSNKHVENINAFIRHHLTGSTLFRVGDVVTVASAIDNNAVHVEGSYIVQDIDPAIFDKFGIPCSMILLNGVWFPFPRDKAKYFAVKKRIEKEAKASGDWKLHFTLANSILDVRDGFACTAHKAQGSTYDKVFIDMSDLSKCIDPVTYLRLAYVAISRARKEVIVYTGE